MNTKETLAFSIRAKMEVAKMIANLGVGHLGGALSITEVLAVLYTSQMRYDPANPQWEERDYLVLSKGHAGPALYATLALKGFYPVEELKTLNRPGTRLPSHCDRQKTPGIDMTCGSLGQGLSVAAGLALSLKQDAKDNRVYAIIGDGESNEGQIWEAALFAAQRKLDNLVAFVDYNHLQLDGPTESICDLGDIGQKFADVGWFVRSVDGHDVAAIDAAVNACKAQQGKPAMIVLNTVKGKGWSKAENQTGSHSRGFTPQELEEALEEMHNALAQC